MQIYHEINTRKYDSRCCNGKKTHAGDWHAKMLENAFILIVPGVAFLEFWILKIVRKSNKTTSKIYASRYSNGRTDGIAYRGAL